MYFSMFSKFSMNFFYNLSFFFFLNIMALEKLSCSLEIKEERHVCGTTFLNQSICQNYLKCFFHNPYLTLTHHYCRDSDLVCPKKKKKKSSESSGHLCLRITNFKHVCISHTKKQNSKPPLTVMPSLSSFLHK